MSPHDLRQSTVITEETNSCPIPFTANHALIYEKLLILAAQLTRGRTCAATRPEASKQSSKPSRSTHSWPRQNAGCPTAAEWLQGSKHPRHIPAAGVRREGRRLIRAEHPCKKNCIFKPKILRDAALSRALFMTSHCTRQNKEEEQRRGRGRSGDRGRGRNRGVRFRWKEEYSVKTKACHATNKKTH